MERLTRPTVDVDVTAAKYMAAPGTIPTDLRSMSDRLLDLVINGPTLNGVNKDVLRQLIRQLYAALMPYENTGLEPEEVERCKLTLMGKSLAEITEFDGVSIERLKELVRAEKAGRLSMQFAVPGQLVYIVERDEDGEACDVSGYMFFAQVNQTVIVSAFINEIDDLDETLLYHIEETSRAYNTDLSVFPVSDCFLSKVEAERALEGGTDNGV